MRIQRITAQNYKGFKNLDLEFGGKSVVIFGVNGTGKSTALSIINHLFWSWINRLNAAQGQAYRSFNSDLVHIGTSSLALSTIISMGDKSFELSRSYVKAKKGKNAQSIIKKKQYDEYVEFFTHNYVSDDVNMPIFVNYGTNRSVLDIPLRIRKKHEFSQLTALERAIENKLDFRTFFEWFRNQEDLENEQKSETGNLSYEDPALKCVRFAIQKMLSNVSSPRVKRSPLRMIVKKNDMEFRVDQLSDGEKCTLALFGDLARRIALANPHRLNPLMGEGIVLIDEIELHMHPTWQRKVLDVLKEVFPQIQFIITTHSPQVLGEADNSYAIYKFENHSLEGTSVIDISRMDGLDSNYILESYMGTTSVNHSYQDLVNKAYSSIHSYDFDVAQQYIDEIATISGLNSKDIIGLEGALKRSKYLYEKNHKG